MAWGQARSRLNASSSSQFRGRNWAAASKQVDGGSQSKLKGFKSYGGGESTLQFLCRSKALPLWFAIVCCVGLVLYARPQISSPYSSSATYISFFLSFSFSFFFFVLFSSSFFCCSSSSSPSSSLFSLSFESYHSPIRIRIGLELVGNSCCCCRARESV